MFERYTENARRVIFFARYEASQFGSPVIEAEHLVLGLVREDKALTNRFLRSQASAESIRKEIEAHAILREKTSTSLDLPLSEESKRVLSFAAEEAEGMGHKHIGTEHLLLGLLRGETSFAAKILGERGLKLGAVRKELKRITSLTSVVSSSGFHAGTSPFSIPSGMFRDLTQAAMGGDPESLIGRGEELNAVIEALCSRRRRNVLLVGEHGVGRSAIVHGLAQRIAEGSAPAPLMGKGVLNIEPDLLVSWTRDRHFDGLIKLLASVPSPEDMILFIHGGEGFLASMIKTAGLNPGVVIRVAIQAGARCIGTGSTAEYRAASESAAWMNELFRPVFVQPLDEAETLLVVQARKNGLERFHEVAFSEEALAFAAEWAGKQCPDGCLPGKALELLDAAAARVKLRQEPVPEIAKQLRRLNMISKREADAIANHEFEKARFYSDEARKERESLEAICTRHGVTHTSPTGVERRDLEEVIASWARYPYTE